MISGTISALNELVLRVEIHDYLGKPQLVEAVIDTGYTGKMTMPISQVLQLGLWWHSDKLTKLADGTTLTVEVYEATLVWDGAEKSIEVLAIGDIPLIGVGLLVGHDLRARIKQGGFVEIEATPP